MYDIIREAPFGQIARYVTGNRVFLYPEEKPDFNPLTLSPADKFETPSSSSLSSPEVRSLNENSNVNADEEQAVESVEKPEPHTISPTVTKNGTVIIDWYSVDDAANPQNWSSKKKFFVALQICLYTFAVYTGSSIYVSSELGVMEEFGVGIPKASLGLGLYVIGYGLGPLLWSPMAEIPYFGRNVPYITTFFIFLILCIPTALVNNFGGLLVLRFLQGFFGSPCLASGGATMQDLYSQLYLPYSIALWTSMMFAGPALGPLLSGFSVVAESWRWSLWEILWMSAPVFVTWFFFLPETSADTILLRRAERLRRILGKTNIQSNSEVKRRGLKPSAIAYDALIKPFEIMILDPAVLFTNVYTALTYGIYYMFFEAFPLVYGPIYGFNLGVEGVAFITIVLGVLVTISIFFALIHFVVIPDLMKNGLKSQEMVLRPALIASFGPPIGLLLFGWTARAEVHWIVSIIGIGIYAGTVFIVVLNIFTYIPMSYPPYAASLFAGNDVCRSAFAFGAVLFSRPMFVNLGIGKGSSLLAGLAFLGVIGVWVLYFQGAKLRARSKFALS